MEFLPFSPAERDDTHRGTGPIRAIVFDLFHTLVDPEDFRPKEFSRAEVVADILRLDKPTFLSFWEGTQRTRMLNPRHEIDYVKDFAVESGITPSKSAFDEAESVLGRYQDLAILNPRAEIVDSMKLLKEYGYKLGLLSNTFERDVRQWPYSPLAQFFDATVFSHEVGLLKPDLGAYLSVLGRLGVDPSSSAFVGDGGSQELVGAKEVGFGLVVFMRKFVSNNGLRSTEELAEIATRADFAVNSYHELCQLVIQHSV